MVAASRPAKVGSVMENVLLSGGGWPVPGNRILPKPLGEPYVR
jgi:hypothetical protein